jgi:hypothetical protein
MSSVLIRGQGPQWRLARLSLLSAAFAALTVVFSFRGRAAILIVMLAGVALSNAGFQLRVAVQQPPFSPADAAFRLRWLAAGLLVAGAILVGAGVAIIGIRLVAL